MNQGMKIIKEVAQVADRDDFYGKAETLGEIASGHLVKDTEAR